MRTKIQEKNLNPFWRMSFQSSPRTQEKRLEKMIATKDQRPKSRWLCQRHNRNIHALLFCTDIVLVLLEVALKTTFPISLARKGVTQFCPVDIKLNSAEDCWVSLAFLIQVPSFPPSGFFHLSSCWIIDAMAGARAAIFGHEGKGQGNQVFRYQHP